MSDPLKDRDWLWSFLVRYTEAYQPEATRVALPPECFDESRAVAPRAKTAIRSLMRQTGLRYGLPLRAPGLVSEDLPPAQAFFLSALVRELDLCGAAALVIGRGLWEGARRRDLLVFLAALLGDAKLSQRAELLASEPPDDLKSERLSRDLARPLWARGQVLVSDPVLGLPLHNGLLYSDARFLARLAVDTYRRNRFSPRVANRLRSYAHRERAALAEALMLLIRAEYAPSAAARRAILGQLRDLGLPAALWRELRKALEFPRPASAIAASIPSQRTRTFILEQVVLGSIADGWHSPKERAFLKQLAETLAIPSSDLARIEADLAEFYAVQPDFVDRFRVQDRLGDLREQVVSSIEETIERNWSVLVYEARQGRELTQALSTVARGGKLDDEQRRRLRLQLLDLAKTIPGLALFAAPGGLLLTMALAKVLPDSFLPAVLAEQRRSARDAAEASTPPPE
jgi:hypothetical protein